MQKARVHQSQSEQMLRVGASAGRVRFSSLWSPRAPARWQGVHRIRVYACLVYMYMWYCCMFVSVETRSDGGTRSHSRTAGTGARRR